MNCPNPIAAWSQRGIFPGAPGTPRPHALGRCGALIMLAALAIRLASLMPGVPVLHWHGAIAVLHPGGGIPHDFGRGACGGPAPSSDTDETPEGAYYSFAAVPEFVEEPPYWGPPTGFRWTRLPPADSVWTAVGATPPGPIRGPPARPPLAVQAAHFAHHDKQSLPKTSQVYKETI